jgi:hypothetical protein
LQQKEDHTVLLRLSADAAGGAEMPAISNLGATPGVDRLLPAHPGSDSA